MTGSRPWFWSYLLVKYRYQTVRLMRAYSVRRWWP